MSRKFLLLQTSFTLLENFSIHHLIYTNLNQLQYWENFNSFSKEIITTPSNSGIALVTINSLSMKKVIKKPKNLIFCLSFHANYCGNLAEKSNMILFLTIGR